MLRGYCSLLFSLVFIGAMAQVTPMRIPYKDTSDMWGYRNANGVTVIAPQWKQAAPFIGNKARVSFYDVPQYCLIDSNGKYLITPEMHWWVKWEGWDKAYLNIDDQQGHWGMADTNGRIIIPMRYAPYRVAGPDLLLSTDNPWHKPALICEQNGKTGVIDTEGHVLIPFEYEYITLNGFKYLNSDFIRVINESEHKATILNGAGQPVLNRTYSMIWCDNWDTRGIRVMDKDKFGYLEYPSLKEIIPCKYTSLIKQEGYFVAATEKGFGLMDSNLNVLIPFSYSAMRVKGNVIEVERIEDIKVTMDQVGGSPVRMKHNRPYAWTTYIRTLDLHTLKPLTDWVEKWDKWRHTMHCGYKQPEKHDPKIVFPGVSGGK